MHVRARSRADRLGEQAAVTGYHVDTFCSVLDLQGLGLRQFRAETRDYLQRVAEISSSHYPETMGAMLIMRAPFIFSAIWSCIKVFVDERTQSKV